MTNLLRWMKKSTTYCVLWDIQSNLQNILSYLPQSKMLYMYVIPSKILLMMWILFLL